MGGSQGSPDWRSQGPWPREDGAHMGGCFCIPGERSLPWGSGEFPEGIWPRAQARVLVQGRLRELVLWKNCFSKDWEKAVISGCLSPLSSLEFPISGREKKKKRHLKSTEHLFPPRSKLHAEAQLCGRGVRAALGSHS